MGRTFFYRLAFLFLATWLFLPHLFSQEINPENEYARIRSIALAGDLDSAAAGARVLVNAFPEYGDARILLARITAWQKDYKNAEAILDTLLMNEPDNADALALKEDISKWSAPEESPSSKESPTSIVAGYSFDSFSEPYARFWQVFTGGAMHDFSWGKGAAFLNVGTIKTGTMPEVRATEYQLEAEAYPRLSSRNYAWLSYAYSPGSYFPTHRAAVEIWQKLPHSWGASAGVNYYYFDRSIFILTASLEKYYGKYWLSGRTYVYLKDNGPTTSFYLTARRYFNETDYFQITAGTGTAPDEPFDIRSNLMRLSARSIRLVYNDRLKNRLTLRIGVGYSDEEYAESINRNRIEGHITVSYPLNKK